MKDPNPGWKRIVSVALNDDGIEEWSRIYEPPVNTEKWEIPYDEFFALCESDILDNINEHYFLMLDWYEDGVIDGDFDYLASLVNGQEESYPVFCEAVKRVSELKRPVYFHF